MDHHLAEAIFGLSHEARLGRGGTKFLLKVIGKNYLSPEILGRKKKGFANPYMEWLIASDRLKLIQQVNNQTGLFHPKELQKYTEMGHQGKFKQHVWGLYVLSHWIKRELL